MFAASYWAVFPRAFFTFDDAGITCDLGLFFGPFHVPWQHIGRVSIIDAARSQVIEIALIDRMRWYRTQPIRIRFAGRLFMLESTQRKGTIIVSLKNSSPMSDKTIESIDTLIRDHLGT